MTFVSRPGRDQAPRSDVPFDRWISADGIETAFFYRDGRSYFIRFPSLADFAIDFNRMTVTATPLPELPEEALGHLYFNQVLPLIMSYNGELVLHASAVATGGRAIAFLGMSRRGKSTLAAAFARAGHPFLTDDGLILDLEGDRYFARPREPRLRLCPDSAFEILGHGAKPDEDENWKKSIAAGESVPHCDQPAPLKAIFVLTESQDPDRPQIARLSRPAAIAQLLQHSFILDSEDRSRVRTLFDQLVELGERVECLSLDYPRRYSSMPFVLDTLIESLKGIRE